MNLFDLYASVSLDSSGYETGVNRVVGGSGRISAAAVAFGTVIAEVVKGAVTALGKLARTSITTGAKWESSFAKVKTIMNPDELGFDDMEDAIINLSKETGIAADELAETVYNVISATGDTAGAVDIAAQATMLATAGFTDTSSALGVLTTAINAYGLSAEEAAAISDSMIMVQNLGVTTVGELSGVMGKAIATGSAYGVNLGNIETGYVALTKAGIGTAEATTYMSGMMNELGKSGSDVSKILQKKTGMSFSELMANGYSLGDVLEILYDSCDGDSAAFMNLWSSAEAGKAASAIAGQGFDNFNEWLGEIEDSAGATERAYATMADTFNHKTSVLKTTIQSKLIQVFERIAPILGDMVEGATAFFDSLDVYAIGEGLAGALQKVQGWIASIDWAGAAKRITAAVKTVIGWVTTLYRTVKTYIGGLLAKIDFESMFAALTDTISNVITWITDNWETILPVLETVGGAIIGIIAALKVMKGVSAIAGVAKAVSGFIAALAANPVLLIVAAIGALIGVLIVLYNNCEPFRTFVNDLFGRIKTFAMPIIEDLKQTVVSAWETIKGAFTGGSESAEGFNNSFAGVGDKVREVWEIVKPILEAFAGFFANQFASKIKLGLNVTSNLFALFAALCRGDWEGVKNALANIIDAIKGFFVNGWDNVKTIFGGIWNAIRAKVATGWESVKTTVSGWIDKLKSSVSTGWETTKAVFSGVWQTLRGYVSNGWEATKTALTTTLNSIIGLFGGSSWDEAKTALQSILIKIATDFVTGFNTIKTTVTTKLNAIKTAISTAVNKIKSWFDWSNWKVTLPHIPTLHIEWETKNLGIFGNTSVPSFKFYAKAMNVPMLLNGATIFGAMGGSMLAGGETGQEVISGTTTLMSMISAAVSDTVSGRMNDIYNLLAAELPGISNKNVVLDSGEVVGALATRFDRALGQISATKKRGNL